MKEVGAHFCCIFACIYREMFDTVLGTKAQLLILLECFCMMSYFLTMVEGLENIAIFQYWHHQKETYPDKIAEFPQCFIDDEMLRAWSGTVIAYSMIEVMIYFSFIFTMIILLIRARFSSIGVDNSH